MKERQVAVVDIGSNTVRLVIYRITELNDFHELQNVKLPAQLYQYLEADGNLSEAGIKQLIEVIQLFQKVMAHYELDHVIATATAVIRQAQNQVAILAEVAETTGLTLRLLTGEEEARYGQYAVARSTEFSEGYTVDMGGGSTEVTYFKDSVVKKVHSFPFGVVTLKERFYDPLVEHKGGNKLTPKEIAKNNEKANQAAKKFVTEQLAAYDWVKPRKLPLIVVGGTARNIANVYQRMTEYPMNGIHEYQMDQKGLAVTFDCFNTLTVKEKQNLDGLSRERAETILPGNLAYLCLFEAVKAEQLVFCHRGLREGLLMEWLNQENPEAYTPENVRIMQVERLGHLYLADTKGSNQRLAIARRLIEELAKSELIFPSERALKYLQAGTYLYHLGNYIAAEDSSMHSFYLVANTNLNGFSHPARLVLALVASYKNKSLFNQYVEQYPSWLDEESLQAIRKVGSIIKFCDALAITKVNEIRQMAFIKESPDTYRLKITWSFDPLAEYYRALRQKKNLEFVLGKKLTLDFALEEGGQ